MLGLGMIVLTHSLVLIDEHVQGWIRLAAVIVLFIALVFCVRGVLFHGGEIWQWYAKKLRQQVIGSRQMALLQYNFKMAAPPVKSKFLALGSSQVRAIFDGKQVLKKYDINKIHFASLRLEEYCFLSDFIRKASPPSILLYMSAYDFANLSIADGFMLLPGNRVYLMRLMDIFRKHHLWKNGDKFLAVIVGEFFPEVKYSYVMRGFWNQYSGWEEVFLHKDMPMPQNTGELKTRLDGMIRSSLKNVPKYLAFKREVLEEFIAFCSREHIRVIILEGHNQALFCDDKIKPAQDLVRKELAALAAGHQNVVFVPLEEQYKFQPEDYVPYDMVHVTSKGAERYLEVLYPVLNRLQNGR